MVPDFRVDALVEAARAVPRAAVGHRGSAELKLSDAELRSVVDALVAAGRFGRRGHRVWLHGHLPSLDAETRERIDRLLDARSGRRCTAARGGRGPVGHSAAADRAAAAIR
jgi:hypothetical protein